MRNLLNSNPPDDQGSEAQDGYDYQEHCVARLCLTMIQDPQIKDTICEYHEDIIQRHRTEALILHQVKKRESSDAWTFSTIKQALVKLFTNLRFKNIEGLVILGNGRASDRPSSKDTECSLAGLIALCDCPRIERDIDWDKELEPYEKHLHNYLGGDLEDISKGLRLLHIDLSIPHPDAIESENIRYLSSIASESFNIPITARVAEDAYKALHKLVQTAMRTPKLPRSKKTITRETAIRLVGNIIQVPSEGINTALDTMKKLHMASLEEHTQYALQKRTYAQEIKLMRDINSKEWFERKQEIGLAWDHHRSSVDPNLRGPALWRELYWVIQQVGNRWNSSGLDSEFAEGLFFEMLATCSVHIRS